MFFRFDWLHDIWVGGGWLIKRKRDHFVLFFFMVEVRALENQPCRPTLGLRLLPLLRCIRY